MQIKNNTNLGFYNIDLDEQNKTNINKIFLSDSRNILHTCINKTYFNLLPFIERIDYLSSNHYGLCVLKAIEEKHEFTLKENVSIIRTLILEIERIICNLNSLRNIFYLTKDIILINLCTEIIETILSFYEIISGHRIYHNLHTLGGFNQNFTVGNFEKTIILINSINEKIMYLIDIAINLPSIKTNLLDLACVKKIEEKTDLRISDEYFYYSEQKIKLILNQEFAIEKFCAYSRFLKLIQDIKNSLNILKYLKTTNVTFNTHELKNYNTNCDTFYKSQIQTPRGILEIDFSTNNKNLIHQIFIDDPSTRIINHVKNTLSNTLVDDINLAINSFFISFLEIIK